MSLERLTEDLGSERRYQVSRDKYQIFVACALFLITIMASFVLFTQALTGSPTISDPGRIVIAESVPGRTPLMTDATFSGSPRSSTSFVMSITMSEPTAEPNGDLFLIVCGAIRNGLHIRDVNGGDLRFRRFPTKPIIYDTVLGDRSECDVATTGLPNGQVLLAGRYDLPLATGINSQILYRLPGVTTVFTPEKFGNVTARPWPEGSTLNVGLGDVPVDLAVNATVPAIQNSGLLSWKYQSNVGATNPPTDYRISGTLRLAENSVQTRIFLAGTLAGIAGAAFIWALGIVVAPRRHRTK